MLKRIVMLVNGLGMARFTQALGSLKERLWNLVNNLRASFTQVSLNVVNRLHLLAKILLSFKVLLANLITAVQSIKLALKPVVIMSGQIGSQLLTTARQTLQRVKALLSRGK